MAAPGIPGAAPAVAEDLAPARERSIHVGPCACPRRSAARSPPASCYSGRRGAGVCWGSGRVMPSRESARRHRWRPSEWRLRLPRARASREATPRPARSSCSVSGAYALSAAAGGWHSIGRSGNCLPSDVVIGDRSRVDVPLAAAERGRFGTYLNDHCASRFSGSPGSRPSPWGVERGSDSFVLHPYLWNCDVCLTRAWCAGESMSRRMHNTYGSSAPCKCRHSVGGLKTVRFHRKQGWIRHGACDAGHKLEKQGCLSHWCSSD
jgi:hypothetical protein